MHQLDELTQELYQSISFRKGELPDLRRLQELFYAGGKLINNNAQPQEFTVRQFIRVVERQIKSGKLEAFREQEVASRTEVFGKIAHRFSTYEAYLNGNDDEPFAVGINSIQCIQVAGTWLVASMVWNDQQPGRAIPAKYFEV